MRTSCHAAVIALCLILQSGCGTTRALPPPSSPSGASLMIGSWNVANLGPSYVNRVEKRPALKRIAEVITSYDLVAIQEVSDAGGKVQVALESDVRERRPSFRMLLSPRTGVQADDKAKQEQYAILYDSDKLTALGPITLYDDSAADDFAREPAYARFKANGGGWTFAIAVIHTEPGKAEEEIAALEKVFSHMRRAYPGEDDLLIVGDYNAGERYAKPAVLNRLEIRDKAKYLWMIPDTADSSTALGTDQAHDRIVSTINLDGEEWTGKSGVSGDAFTFDEKLSDHYPVWARFWTNER